MLSLTQFVNIMKKKNASVMKRFFCHSLFYCLESNLSWPKACMMAQMIIAVSFETAPLCEKGREE